MKFRNWKRLAAAVLAGTVLLACASCASRDEAQSSAPIDAVALADSLAGTVPFVDQMTPLELDAAVNAGELALKWDGRQVKVDRAVNSFVTTSQGMLDSFKKIKIVEIMDLIRTDITATAEDSYIGKYANTYDNKLLLVTAIRGYFMGLEQDQLVQPGYTVDIDVSAQEQYLVARGVDTSEMTEQEIREADTGSHVFLLIRCKILDAIEDIDIQVEI